MKTILWKLWKFLHLLSLLWYFIQILTALKEVSPVIDVYAGLLTGVGVYLSSLTEEIADIFATAVIIQTVLVEDTGINDTLAFMERSFCEKGDKFTAKLCIQSSEPWHTVAALTLAWTRILTESFSWETWDYPALSQLWNAACYAATGSRHVIFFLPIEVPTHTAHLSLKAPWHSHHQILIPVILNEQAKICLHSCWKAIGCELHTTVVQRDRKVPKRRINLKGKNENILLF